MMIHKFRLRERAGRDKNIQSFFHGLEIPFRADVENSPYLTVLQKQQMDYGVRLRVAVIANIARAINALIRLAMLRCVVGEEEYD